jgi:hypothetical protein
MRKGLIIFVLILAGFRGGYAQEAKSVTEAQTWFIYNFSRMIQWPASSKSGEFVIGVVGDNELFNKMTEFAANKKVGSQPISVKKFDDPQSVVRCHIVFIGDSKNSRLGEVISKLQGSNTLIITERKGMINSGSAIDFFLENDKLKFVINPDNAEKYNLIVSKTLEDMAYKN